MKFAVAPGDAAMPDLPERTDRFHVKPHALGVKPGFRPTSMNQLYDQIEAEHTASRARSPSTNSTHADSYHEDFLHDKLRPTCLSQGESSA